MTNGLPPSPSLPLERRWNVYGLLLNGLSVRDVSERLKVPRQRVHEDVSYLVELGALRKLSAAGSRLRVERGDAAARYEKAALETLSGDRRERFSAVAEPRGLAVRAHHWRWSRPFNAGPSREVPWTGEAVASGVPSKWLTVEDEGGGFVVRAYLGRHRRRIQIAAPPMVVESGPDVLAAEARMARRAQAVGQAFAARYGITLCGVWKQSHPTEYAAPPVPGLEPFGTPGESPVWADESPGEGKVEPETRAPRVAAAWADLPRYQEEVEARLRALEEAAFLAVQRDDRLITIIARKTESVS